MGRLMRASCNMSPLKLLIQMIKLGVGKRNHNISVLPTYCLYETEERHFRLDCQLQKCILRKAMVFFFFFFFFFFFYRFFSQQVRVGGRNKSKNKIHSDHFPIELKSKETHLCFLRF